MKIETQLATIEGRAGEQTEVLIENWEKQNGRKIISWKDMLVEDIVHLVVEHASPENYIKINEEKEKGGSICHKTH